MPPSTVTSPTPAAIPPRATTRVPDAKSYSWWLRIADNLHGFADRKRWGDDPGALQERPWVYRLCYTYAENVERVRCTHRDRLASAVVDLHDTRLGIQDVERRLQVIHEVSIGEPETGSRGRGETHLDAAAVATRRLREHARLEAAQRARIAAMEAERDALIRLAASLNALLQEQHQFLIETAHRMHSFYSRRLGTYARRQGPRAGEVSAALDLPDWVHEECPWLPDAPAVSSTSQHP
jgi:hypothetical protein